MASDDMQNADVRTPSDRKLSLDEAVTVAKEWLMKILEKEDVKNIGLEEVSHQGQYWHVTLGFSRPWDRSRNALTVIGGDLTVTRTYKSLIVDERTGNVVSMKNVDRS